MNIRPWVRYAAAAAVFVLAGAVLLGVGVWAGAGEDQAALGRAARAQAVTIVLGALLIAAGIVLLVARIFARYVTPLRRIAADVRLIATTNPGHRIGPDGSAEVAALAGSVNDLAGRYQTAQALADARFAADRAGLEADRNRLAALMSELALGVLVCTVDGQIQLYNEAARELLGRSTVGLGRSVFGALDRQLLAHAVDRIEAGAESFQAATTIGGSRLVRVRVAPVSDAGGYVLTLEDMTRHAEAGQRRDATLRALGDGTRAPLAAIRAAIEALLDYPDMAADERQRFAEIIREETHRLSGHVEMTLAHSAAYLTDRWQAEDVHGADLLAAMARAIPGDVRVAEPDGDVWLEAETHPLAQAVADLVGRLGVDEVALSIGTSGAHGTLDVRWSGDADASRAVREWSAQRYVADLLERHDGEAWAAQDGTYLRVLLRRSRTAPQRAPAKKRPPAPSRPEFYDFDLFRLAEPGDERTLAELAYTVFDTETTGLEPSAGDEIISIGAARIVGGRLLRQETYEQLVDPGRSVPAASQRVHGISGAMLAGQPKVTEVLPEFARFAGGSVLLGHNVAFDLKFLALKEAASGIRFDQPVLDTLLLSPLAHPDHDDHSLEGIAARLGVTVLGRHTALGDALLTGELFVRLLPLLADRGIVTLGQALDASRRTQQAKLRY